jgi:hypothetical protein
MKNLTQAFSRMQEQLQSNFTTVNRHIEDVQSGQGTKDAPTLDKCSDAFANFKSNLANRFALGMKKKQVSALGTHD